MSEIPAISLPDLFVAQMLKGNHHDAAETAEVLLQAVYAAYKPDSASDSPDTAIRKPFVLRGKAALELLESAEKAYEAKRERICYTKNDAIPFLMKELLRGWFASEDEADTDRFATALLYGHPQIWLERGEPLLKLYEGLGKEVEHGGPAPFYHGVDKLLRLLARLPDTFGRGLADREMVYTLVRGLTLLDHEWLGLMARYTQAWRAVSAYVPRPHTLETSLDHARAMAQTELAARDLNQSLILVWAAKTISIPSPHRLRFSLNMDYYDHYDNPERAYANRWAECQAKSESWRLDWEGEHPDTPIAVELSLIVHEKDGSVAYQFSGEVA